MSNGKKFFNNIYESYNQQDQNSLLYYLSFYEHHSKEFVRKIGISMRVYAAESGFSLGTPDPKSNKSAISPQP